MRKTCDQNLSILLIEDNPGDALLATEAIKECRPDIHVETVDSGHQAMTFLQHSTALGPGNYPDLILLDINLPQKSGREILADIKADPLLRIIPVVMLTTSAMPSDIRTSYDLGAAGYLVKALGYDEFVTHLGSVLQYWFSTVLLPHD